MSSHRASGNAPTLNEVRVVERDGQRWLQQWRQKPHGYAYEYAWIDVSELPRLPRLINFPEVKRCDE